jgi:hypothetical protein
MQKLSANHTKAILIAVSLLFLSVPVSSVWACKCRVNDSAAAELKNKDVVLLGKVVEEQKALMGSHPYELPRSIAKYRYVIVVEKSWKGNFGAKINILSGGGGGDCGYGRLKIGQSLLIYANQYKQASTVADSMAPPTLTVCSRTKPADLAQDDIRALDAAVKAR